MQSGYGAYQKTAKHTEAPRQLEYRLLGQVNAALLEGAKQQPDRRRVIEALLWNKQVWDHFMMDLLDETNNLPKPTRASLTQLGVWMNKEVTKELSASKTDPTSIIEINQIIMKGLAGISPDGSQPAQQAAPNTANQAPPPGTQGGNPAPQKDAGPYRSQPPAGYKRYTSDA